MSYVAKGSLIAGALAVGSSFSGGCQRGDNLNSRTGFRRFITGRRQHESFQTQSGCKRRQKVKMDKGALAKPPGQFDLAVNGVRDMVMHVAAYTPG